LERAQAQRKAAEKAASEARAAADAARQVLAGCILGLKDALTGVQVAQAHVETVLSSILQAAGVSTSNEGDWHKVVENLQQEGQHLWSQQPELQAQAGLIQWPAHWEGPDSLGASRVFGQHSTSIQELLFSEAAGTHLSSLDVSKDWEAAKGSAKNAARAAISWAQAAERGQADVEASLQHLHSFIAQYQQVSGAESTQAPVLQL
jgi:hypothetical protein